VSCHEADIRIASQKLRQWRRSIWSAGDYSGQFGIANLLRGLHPGVLARNEKRSSATTLRFMA
jgi:hypothetical protein